MTLCLVTDRRRVCSDASDVLLACRCLAEQVRHAVDAGIDLVQVRERDLTTADLADLVSDLVRLRRGTRTRIVVNDRVDVAVACGADGAHLRGDSMSADAVRRIAPPGFLVGRSVHNVNEARTAGPVDYLIAGTIFATASKPAAVLLGVEGLASVVESCPSAGPGDWRGVHRPCASGRHNGRGRGRCYRLVHWFRCRGWGAVPRGAAWDARRRDSSTV